MKTNTKITVAAFATISIIAGGAILYSANEDHTVEAASNAQFARYLAQHGKSYATPQEFSHRAAIFAENAVQVNKWNSGRESHRLGFNHMSDWTKDEIKRRNGLKVGARTGRQHLV